MQEHRLLDKPTVLSQIYTHTHTLFKHSLQKLESKNPKPRHTLKITSKHYPPTLRFNVI